MFVCIQHKVEQTSEAMVEGGGWRVEFQLWESSWSTFFQSLMQTGS